MEQVDRSVLTAKKGPPWGFLFCVGLVAVIGGGLLGFTYNYLRWQLAAPPDLAAEIVAEVEAKASSGEPQIRRQTGAFSPAREAMKYDAVLATIDRCERYGNRARLREVRELYVDANEHVVAPFQQAQIDAFAEKAEAVKKTGKKISDRAQTKLGAISLIADGTMADITSETAAMMADGEMLFGGKGLLRGNANVESCTAFANDVWLGAYAAERG